jgi:putative sigma-54 modulation protein
MEVKIQSVKFDASKQLIEFVEKKMSRLERFEERATGADVIFKLDKDSEKGNKVALVTLRVPGGDIVTEQRAHTFEEAVDLALDALKRQIEKKRDR